MCEKQAYLATNWKETEMGSLIGLFTFIIGVFFLVAIWRVVMDLPEIRRLLKDIKLLLISQKEK